MNELLIILGLTPLVWFAIVFILFNSMSTEDAKKTGGLGLFISVLLTIAIMLVVAGVLL